MRLGVAEWSVLIRFLMPESLPAKREECMSLLQTTFGENLPEGVVRAFSLLACIGHEHEAHELLVAFLSEKHDSERLSRLLQAGFLAGDVPKVVVLDPSSTPEAENSELESGELFVADDGHQDWSWIATDEVQAPQVDDTELRALASMTQGSIGSYSAEEGGAVVLDFAQSFDNVAWDVESTDSQTSDVGLSAEHALVERTGKLGTVGLDLLNYFVDNPGDRAVHAEHVLGHHVADINKLLMGPLKHYLKKTGSGGWECHSWVPGVLLMLGEE